MSEIRATTISDAAGTGPITLTGQSAAKAWATLGGSFEILDSFNVSSSSDLGTANSQITYTNSLTGNPSASVEADASTAAAWFTSIDSLGTSTASAVTFNTSGSLIDGRPTYYIVAGDLA